jgi:hypothetical protein
VNGPADIDVIAEAGIVTSRYQDWQAACGVPVRITVGEPKFWKGPRLADGRTLAPWGLLDPSIPTDECRRLYVARLDAGAERTVAVLARMVEQHPGERLVLLCFENVHGGEVCHRRWFAEWFEDRHGIVVAELPADRVSEQGQLRLL